MIESVQPQGNELSFAFSFSLAAGACVRVCLVRPPHAPSLRRCPQFSTLVRDHRGRACVPEKWAVLPSAQIQPKLSLGGGCMEVRVAPFPSQIEGTRSVELLLDLPNDVRGGGKRRSGGNVSVGRTALQVVPHSLTSKFHGVLLKFDGNDLRSN